MKPIELKGHLVSIGDERQISSTFSKREFVIDIGDDKYPNECPVELVATNMDLIDHFGAGEEVIIQCYLRGWARGVNLRCIGIQHVETGSKQRQPVQKELMNEPPDEYFQDSRSTDNNITVDNPTDDLPF